MTETCRGCHTCLIGVISEFGFPETSTRMITCSDCGNKRCPKATDHENMCTGSNASGQVGSIYGTPGERYTLTADKQENA